MPRGEPEKVDRVEGSKFKIKISATKGILGTGPKTAKIEFACPLGGADPALKNEEVALEKTKSVYHEFDLPKVVGDKPFYKFKYKVVAGKKTYFDSPEYTVWPETMDVTAKYKKKGTEPFPDGITSEGAAVAHFPFRIAQGSDVSARLETGEDGTRKEAPLPSTGIARVSAVSPWEILEPTDQSAAGRNRELKVCKGVWVAEIKAPVRSDDGGKTEDKPLKHYVNMGKDYAANKGPLVKVEVGAKDNAALAKKDDKVFFRVTFPKENSKRQDPWPGVWTSELDASAMDATDPNANPGEAKLVYEGEALVDSDGGVATFYINMSAAGGDRCFVEVGVTKTREDDKLYVQGWRKIGLEMFVPKVASRQKCPNLLGDAGATLGDQLKTQLERCFDKDKTFIEFEVNATNSKDFDDTSITRWARRKGGSTIDEPSPHAEYMVVKKEKLAYFEKNSTGQWVKKALSNGDKVFIASFNQLRYLRETLVTTAKNKDTMDWKWCDMISSREFENSIMNDDDPETNVQLKDPAKVTNFFNLTMDGAETKDKEITFEVFDYDPVLADGSLGIKAVTWRAFKYRKKGETDWKPVTDKTPGKANRLFKDVDFADLATSQKWAQIKDSRTVTVKLPKDAPGDPGNHVKETVSTPKKDGSGNDDVEYEINIQLQFTCYGVNFGILGGAAGGSGLLRTSCGLASVKGMASTVAHEIGHNCGQAYIPKQGTVTGGHSGAQIVGIPFAKPVPEGHYYVGKGHTGAHCAKALFDIASKENAKKKKSILEDASYASPSSGNQKYFAKVEETNQCIMYGSGDPDTQNELNFCDDCKGHLKIMDLSDITKRW
jgi:hypothetical protein